MPLACQRRGQSPHLPRAIEPRAVDLQVNGHRHERRLRALDRRHQRDVAPEHALSVVLNRPRARQLHDPGFPDRPARENREAEQGFEVLAPARLSEVLMTPRRGFEKERGPDRVPVEGAP